LSSGRARKSSPSTLACSPTSGENKAQCVWRRFETTVQMLDRYENEQRGTARSTAMSSADKANPYELDLDKNPATTRP